MILNNYRDLQITFLSYLTRTRDELDSIIKIYLTLRWFVCVLHNIATYLGGG